MQGSGLARRRGLRSPPLSLEAWGALLGPDGEITKVSAYGLVCVSIAGHHLTAAHRCAAGQLADEKGFRARVFHSGCDTQVSLKHAIGGC